jgi:hypothetical protein
MPAIQRGIQMKIKYFSLIAVLFVSSVSFANGAKDLLDKIGEIQCVEFHKDPLGYIGCQLGGTTLLPSVTITGFVATTVGTSEALAHKEALLNEAAPYAAEYLISPESQENNPVLHAAFQLVADEPNTHVDGSPELAQRILDAVKAE